MCSANDLSIFCHWRNPAVSNAAIDSLKIWPAFTPQVFVFDDTWVHLVPSSFLLSPDTGNHTGSPGLCGYISVRHYTMPPQLTSTIVWTLRAGPCSYAFACHQPGNCHCPPLWWAHPGKTEVTVVHTNSQHHLSYQCAYSWPCPLRVALAPTTTCVYS